MDETALNELMVAFAKSKLTPSQYYDASTVKVFKAVTFDVDGDGEDETCFAAGFAAHFAPGICALLDPSPDGPRFVELVPRQAGFRELVVADMDKDGHAEILTTWFPSANGDALALAIFRYDGSEVSKVFPDELFYEGYLESKDIDADGVDELVLWRSAMKRRRWEAAPYQISVYQGTPAGYRLAFTHDTASRYNHWSIASRDVGIMGLPTGAEHRHTSVAERQRQFTELRAAGQLTDEFVEELRGQASVLCKETFLEDALGIFDIAAEANQLLLPAPKARQHAVLLCYGRAGTALLLGDHKAAEESYRRAAAGADEEAIAGLPGHFLAHLHRELGLAQALMGDYENALASQATAFALLDGVTAADADGLTALSLLHSNAGLTWSWIGDEQQAIRHFKEAADIDDQRGNPVQRAYDEAGIGNVHRLAGARRGDVLVRDGAAEPGGRIRA